MATKETMDTIEKTIDVIDETLDTIERIPTANLNGTTKHQQVIILTVTAGVSAVTASLLTYAFLNKKLKLRYELIAEEEIAEAKQFYSKLNKTDEFATPEAAAQKLLGDERPATPATLDEVIDQNQYRPSEDSSIMNHPVAEADAINQAEAGLEGIEGRTIEVKKADVINVFTESSSTLAFDLEEEMKNRGEGYPYVITEEEFMENEPEYEQVTVTYYENDDILADDRDKPIDDSDTTVGDRNLTRFGMGTKEKHLVYVRNERLQMDFEIARHTGSFAEAVHGFIQHEDRPGIRKFRDRG